jgi:hypothetical protein
LLYDRFACIGHQWPPLVPPKVLGLAYLAHEVGVSQAL